MEALKRIGKAFLVGGAIGLIGQILVTAAAAFAPADLVIPVAMLVFGVLAIGVITSGLYFKIAKHGGDGAAIPLCGLMFGAGMAAGGAKTQGASSWKAFFAGFTAIFKILGIGLIICIVLGLIFK